MNPLVIIGTGLAGYGLAKELRKLKDSRPITLITGDDGSFYSKPMLSSALAQNKDAQGLVMASAEQMSEQLDAQVLTHTFVDHIEPAKRQVVLTDGQVVSYAQLVLAVGANPIQLPFRGTGASDVMQVNSLADYAQWRDRLKDVEKVILIGPGLIGCEFANDLLKVGKKVALVGPDPWPISTLIPEKAGRALQQVLKKVGAQWHLETFNGAIEKEGRHYQTTLKNGTVVDGDLVLSAVGLKPNVDMAKAAGLAVNRGIVTNEYLQTSDPHIYALGDCAEVNGANLPYVQPLMVGGRALAATLAHKPTPVIYPIMPVVIKTTLHPIVTMPPGDRAGSWFMSHTPKGVMGRYMGEGGVLEGFVLTGEHTKLKSTLVKEMQTAIAA
ncbi:NAD(P)/FAD-dependent oxidoreductase [Magnetococcus sp. PR-3]|uniref:NAD(P)/FAD-dependent oxidoreductase n=1 Tax=Magnetococcus sp. PR-3 TaxID=3120355 RepID=UPI002FCDFC94